MLKIEEFKNLYEAWDLKESERDKVYKGIAAKYTDWSNEQLQRKYKELDSRKDTLSANDKVTFFEIHTEMKKRGLFGPF